MSIINFIKTTQQDFSQEDLINLLRTPEWLIEHSLYMDNRENKCFCSFNGKVLKLSCRLFTALYILAKEPNKSHYIDKYSYDNERQNSTINKYVKFISAIYNFMIDSDAATRNPVVRIKPLKEIKNDKIRALSTQEVQALLLKTKLIYPDFYPMLFTALFAGMRRGELLALTWDSINWVKGKITVDKNYVNGKLGTPKSSKTRYVDMSDELARVLKQWRLACPCSELNLVFPNSEGKYQSADNMIKRRFIPSLNRAGIDLIRFHDLRHTYASLLLANGAPMKYVQTQLGHASITMTMDLYTHLLPEVNDKCVNLLNSIVNNAIKTKEKYKIFGT